MAGEHILGLSKKVIQVRSRHDAQRDFAVDAAKGEVVDLVAKRRNIRPFAGINLDRQHVFAVKVHVSRELKRERRIATLVFAEPKAVQPDGRSGHYALDRKSTRL